MRLDLTWHALTCHTETCTVWKHIHGKYILTLCTIEWTSSFSSLLQNVCLYLSDQRILSVWWLPILKRPTRCDVFFFFKSVILVFYIALWLIDFTEIHFFLVRGWRQKNWMQPVWGGRTLLTELPASQSKMAPVPRHRRELERWELSYSWTRFSTVSLPCPRRVKGPASYSISHN